MIDPEKTQIEEILRNLDFPKEVTAWDIELGSDWTDNPGVWITLAIADNAWSKEWLRTTGRELRVRLQEAILESNLESWPYPTLMTASDYASRSERSRA